MRVLYVPFFSNVNLGGCSIFNNMKIAARTLVERHPDVFVHYPLPGPPFEQNGADYLKHPRIETFTVPAIRYQENDTVYVPPVLFDRFNIHHGDVGVDLVLCDKHRLTPWIKLLMNQHLKSPDASVPVVNYAQYPMCDGEVGNHSTPEWELSQTLGIFTAPTMWACNFDLQLCLKVARKWCLPHVVRTIEDNAILDCGVAIDCARIDKHMIEKPRDQILINYGFRLSAAYGIEENFDEVDKMYRAGRKLKLIITTPSASAGRVGGGLLNKLKKLGVPHEAHIACPQDDFFRIASGCHIALRTADGSESSVSFLEHVYMRVACLLPWAKKVEPWMEGYPWTYKNKAEMHGMARYLVDNYWSDEVQSTLDKYRERVLQHKSCDGRADRMYGHFSRIINQSAPTGKMNESVVGITRDTLDRW